MTQIDPEKLKRAQEAYQTWQALEAEYKRLNEEYWAEDRRVRQMIERREGGVLEACGRLTEMYGAKEAVYGRLAEARRAYEWAYLDMGSPANTV